MLVDLRVKDLLLIDEAELRLAPGLNVLTGETGAGKTVLAHALDLLLGGRPRSGIVRPGAREALVEGVFELPAAARASLGELIDEEENELVLARRVQAGGRTRAMINGRTTTVGDLRALASTLLSFYGQHEHRRLTAASEQLAILDSFCGDAQARLLADCGEAHARVLSAQEEILMLEELDGARERELDILRYEIAEIDAAAPSSEQEAELLAVRGRLANVEALRAGAAAALQALEPDDGEGAADRLALGQAALAEAAGADGELDALGERLAALAMEAADIAGELRRYAEGLEGEPGEIDEVEARLSEWERLKRKHGGTIEAVLDYAERSRARCDLLAGSEEAMVEARERLEAAEADRAKASARLRQARRRNAPKLAEMVRARLAALAMPGAGFEVDVTVREPGPLGADSVEFMVAPNPGVPAGPVRDIASGGELSRVMLALLSIASDGSHSTLVFDEVDAGIGGQTANAVGEQLVGLASARQVICITHLPQVAALADGHFAIRKETAGDDSRTTVTELDDEAVLEELVRMLGAPAGDRSAREHARRLRNGGSSPQAAAA